MIAASVGFQCPDDVKAGSKGVREARTAFGGRVSGDTSKVTITLIGINVVIFVLGLAQPDADLSLRFGQVAGTLIDADGTVYKGVADGAYYRLLTSAFLHANVLHILSNMFALAQLGPQLETTLGRGRFLALYILSALGGSTLSLLLSEPFQRGVGASGAIFGLIGAFYVVLRHLGRDTSSILVLLGINLVITFAVPIIDWRAHLGGLATGAVIAVIFAYAPRGPRRSTVQAAGCVAVAVVLLAAVLLRVAALRDGAGG